VLGIYFSARMKTKKHHVFRILTSVTHEKKPMTHAAFPITYESKPDANGIYYLGPNRDYILAPDALRHITSGDVSDRPVRDDQNKTTHIEKILKGGLHTADGWLWLKKQWPQLVHGGRYLSDTHGLWYFARELQNEVILLKIPSELFQSKAAKLTKFSDIYYKSGFLWKTLFPLHFSEGDITSVVNEALHKQDREESTPQIIIGYALTAEHFGAIKVRIQLTGKNINSAFPTWDQPNTGNNGKAYAHFDSISFQIAESTEFFDEWEAFQQAAPAWEKETIDSFDALHQFTPAIFFERSAIKKGHAAARWENELRGYARSASTHAISRIVEYVNASFVLKDPFGFLLSCANRKYDQWKNRKHCLPVLSVYQNFIDSLIILEEYDSANGTKFCQDTIFKFIDSKFNRTGGIDLWESKRIFRHIFDYIERRDDTALSWEFLKKLATSPTRTAWYVHFDLNIFYPFDITTVGLNIPKVHLESRHLHRFIANLMGSTYFTMWDVQEREKLARAAISSYCTNSHLIVDLAVKYATSADFECFAFQFDRLVPSLLRDISKLDIVTLDLILHDYYRLCLESQHRVIADNFEILSAGRSLEFEDRPGSAYWKYAKTKHERMYLGTVIGLIEKSYLKIYKAAGRKDLAEKTTEMVEKFYREKMPLPKPIPTYFPSWRDNAKPAQPDINALIELMYGPNNGMPEFLSGTAD